MASRHSVDVHFNPRRDSEGFPWQYSGSSQATPFDHNRKGFADMHHVVSGEKGSSRRRSFHGGELKREMPGNRKASSSVSIVGLGCWAPSQSTKAVMQTSHPPSQEPWVPIVGGHAQSFSEQRGSSQGQAEAHPSHSSAGAIQTLDSNNPTMYPHPVPNSSWSDETPYQKSTALHKSTRHHSDDKSRRRHEQGVREVQVAIHRLSSKLKRMDLDEVLLSATSQELAAEKCGKDASSAAREERLQEISTLNADQTYIPLEEVSISRGRDFAKQKSGRVHSRHRARRRKRDHGLPDQLQLKLSCHLEEINGQDSREQDADFLLQTHAAENAIQDLENVKAEALHVEVLEEENSADVGSIELEVLSSPRKGLHLTNLSPVGQVPNGDDAMLTLELACKAYVAEVSSSDNPDEAPDSNTTKGLCSAGCTALEEILNKEQDGAQASHSVSHLDGAESPPNNLDCNGTKSPCFSELLLSSSDVTSPGSEDSSQLSEALQNLSGGQGHKVTKDEESLTRCSHSPQAKQCMEQSSQTYDVKRRVCSKEHSFSPLRLCNNRSSSFSTSGDHEKAFLWLHEQDEASQRSAVDIDITLVLKRFGNVLLSSIPCEGMHVVTLEPLFHETIRIAKSFLREFSSHVFELSKNFFRNEYLDEQRDRKVSFVRMAPLPNTLFIQEHHIKYGVQALLNEPIFAQFDKPSYCGDSRNADGWVLLVEFQRFCTLSPIDAIEPTSDSYDKYFHSLCSKKFQLLKDKCVWLNEWPDHLLQAFLGAMKYVWQAHLLARASVDTIHTLQFEEWSPYDSSVMEVVDYDHDAAAFISRVQFMLSPGFKLQGSVVKSEVYLIPKT